ncbi:hypothetical protein K2173_025574 [Erythroxylum novogranatense]|uniref:Uncharacterized protein n=1 Tax=Erythroxylum novogranatense TaxID=1862640 RepID=A0AAV8TA33_9ROSI|nr:hypothetical protein K2173_025574 [Erythroxylum novogranatense]
MSSSLFLLLLSLNISLVLLSYAAHETAPKGVDPENPVLNVTPSPLYGKLSGLDSKDILYCERVRVSGHSRLKLQSYANSFRVTLSPSLVIPERLHGRIQICFHRNASRNLCHCGMDEWKTVQKGLWNSVMSPFDERYLDVKFIGEIHGSVTVAMAEDQQLWRLLCLAVGFVILLFAPIVSRWVPFYYSTSMAIGIFLVILIILFQGMKLLPTGRKNIFYLSIYGSVLGAGTFVLHHISVLVNSILVNFGLSDEMHNPVYVFVLVGIVLAGAALGYWIVRKFVIEKDGTVDVGIAEFVKWAMRIIATTFILQSTLDTPLAIVVWALTYLICFHINKWLYYVDDMSSAGGSAWLQQRGQLSTKKNRTEFLSRSAKSSPGGKMWNSPKSPSSWSTPVKGLISPSGRPQATEQRDYYSTFHKTSKRKKFSKKEWDDFTRESTRQAVAEWAASPEVTTWIIENADRIQLLPSDCSSEETVGSESDSTGENNVRSGKRFSLFTW